jgi:hypothetical protein
VFGFTLPIKTNNQAPITAPDEDRVDQKNDSLEKDPEASEA